MRILHQVRMGKIKALYFYLNCADQRIDSERVCSLCNKYEKEVLFLILSEFLIYNAFEEGILEKEHSQF